MCNARLIGLNMPVELDRLRAKINSLTRVDEAQRVRVLLEQSTWLEADFEAVEQTALEHVTRLRKVQKHPADLDPAEVRRRNFIRPEQMPFKTAIAEIYDCGEFEALMDDALRMNAGALSRHNVTVVKHYAQVPEILADKHRLLLILINLISNAKYAMSNLTDRPRQMTLTVQSLEDSTLQISVKDDGEGIAPENMTRIFAHGFTTRKEGHGFGLHSCALAAIEMNGHLTAHSDGPGQGALFTLQIPLISVTENA